MKLKKTNKGQFLILSASLVLSLLFFIYSIETENSYIIKSTKFYILDNIKYESCNIGKLSNGSYLDQRFLNFSGKVKSYCEDRGFLCELNITKKNGAPTNLSLLNYTSYNYRINYSVENYKFEGNFTC